MHDDKTTFSLARTATHANPIQTSEISGTKINQSINQDNQAMAFSSQYTRDETIVAITDLYNFYIRLPCSHLCSRRRLAQYQRNRTRKSRQNKGSSRTSPPSPLSRSMHGGWTIYLESDRIEYHKGVCYRNDTDPINPLPGHVIPIAYMASWDGSYLLLDMETGQVTGHNNIGQQYRG